MRRASAGQQALHLTARVFSIFQMNLAVSSVFQIRGVVTTFISGVGLGNPNGIAFDSADNLYVADAGTGSVAKFDSAGNFITLNLATGFNVPQGIVTDDSAGVVYVSDNNGEIYQVDMITGATSLYAYTSQNTNGGLARDAAGNLYLSGWSSGMVVRVAASDQSLSVCVDGIQTPRGLAFDSAGLLYVTAYDAGEIYQFNGCQPLTTGSILR